MKKVFIPLLTLLIIASCSKKEDFSGAIGDGGIEQIELGLVYRPASLRDQIVDFSLFDEEGNDITADAVFYVNDELLESNEFSSAQEGSFEVYAEYELDGSTITTEVEIFDVISPVRKAAIEDYTGTWCGYCPRITAAIDVVRELTDDVVVIAIHNGDDMALPFEGIIREEFEVDGFPSGRINRTIRWSMPHAPEDVTAIAGTQSPLGIGIRSQLNGADLAVEVALASETALDNMKLVVYLLEDGILRDQTNYFNNDPSSPYYQKGNPIIDYEHNDVLRASLTDIFGDAIPPLNPLEEFKAEFTTSLPAEFVKENMHIAVMVVDQDNTALNAQIAKLEEVKAYE